MAKTPGMSALYKAVVLATIATGFTVSALSAETAGAPDSLDATDSITTPDGVEGIDIGDISQEPAPKPKKAKTPKKPKKPKKEKIEKKPALSKSDEIPSDSELAEIAEPAEPPPLFSPSNPNPPKKPQPDKKTSSTKSSGAVKTPDPGNSYKLKYGYEGTFDATIAGHLYAPQDLASQKLNFAFEQNASYGPDWKGVFGFSAWDEGSFATVPARYSGSVVRDDSRDLRIRNAYIQYRNDDFFLRIGNQQVVWGEAFGFFYSDIINPKDLRYGLFGDFSQIRLQTPMANAKLTFSNLSIQGIFIPKPYFNILPSPGNDFAFPYASVTGIPNTTIKRETSLSLSTDHFEAGGRISYLLDRLDLSVFYFNYFDRDPWYVISPDSQPPSSLVLEERHSRVRSYGITATDEIEGLVFRVEALTTKNRVLPVAVTTPFGNALGTTELDDYIYVIGMDVPPWEKWNLGFQWSQDILSRNAPGLFRNQIISLASLRLQRPIFTNQSAELLYTYSVRDAGQRLEFNYLIPLSGRVETSFGFDVLGGPQSSSFGSIYQATRGYVLFKYFLKARG